MKEVRRYYEKNEEKQRLDSIKVKIMRSSRRRKVEKKKKEKIEKEKIELDNRKEI